MYLQNNNKRHNITATGAFRIPVQQYNETDNSYHRPDVDTTYERRSIDEDPIRKDGAERNVLPKRVWYVGASEVTWASCTDDMNLTVDF